MSEDTKIQWATHTFNPWSGCTKVNAGCTNCYAEVNYSVKMRGVKWGPNGTRVKASDSMWKQPLKWDRIVSCNVAHGGKRPRVFCASLADVFEDWQGDVIDHKGRSLWTCACGHIAPILPELCEKCGNPKGLRLATMDDLRRDLFALIDATPHLDWLLLTKRPENVRRMWPDKVEPCKVWFFDKEAAAAHGREVGGPHEMTLVRGNVRRDNVWLLTSVSDQATADAAIPELLKCRDLCPVIGASYEPALGPVNFEIPWEGEPTMPTLQLDWVIVGGESGAHARPFDVAWARSTIEQCRAAQVPVFCKQLGSKPVVQTVQEAMRFQGRNVLGVDERKLNLDVPMPYYAGLRLRDPKGGDMAEWPEWARVREFPEVTESRPAAG